MFKFNVMLSPLMRLVFRSSQDLKLQLFLFRLELFIISQEKVKQDDNKQSTLFEPRDLSTIQTNQNSLLSYAYVTIIGGGRGGNEN